MTLHQVLKDSTMPRHQKAEGHEFQSKLAQGALPLATYRSYLCQLAHLHERFEENLRVATKDPLVKSVVKSEYFQLPYLLTDLAAIKNGGAPEPPLRCVLDFTMLPVFEKQPIGLLGVLYVLLGSKHGGKFIAHKVKETYGLTDAGYKYFDPFGDKFRELWLGFTSSLNALPEDPQIQSSVLEGANSTFDVFLKIGDEIWEPHQ